MEHERDNIDEMRSLAIQVLSQKVDKRSKFLSGGFEGVEGFQDIIDHGKLALPFLLHDLRNDEASGWWRMQAIWTIANNMGLTIDYAEEDIGINDRPRLVTLEWGIEHGYLMDEV